MKGRIVHEQRTPKPARWTSDLDLIYGRIETAGHYDILGVPDSASATEIKRAYHKLARLYHPDRIGGNAGPEIVQKAERIFARITEAYQVLVDDFSREAYDRAGPEGKKQFGARAARKPVSKEEAASMERWAETYYKKGLEAFKAHTYADAVRHLVQAVNSSPRNAQYALALAWAYARNAATAQKAEQAFVRAITLDKFNPDPYVQMGKYYKEIDEVEKATALLRRALAMDDQHEEALKELSTLTATPWKKKSLWGKIIGR